ncbi:trypsin-like [Choristoneura fumiferana]|uniref:trypsin-like n=1 Tax=Choristoneura fumiferana TaxID=7141 RepID=UPI003D15C490
MWWLGFVLVVGVFCENNETIFHGVLNPDCVASYFRMFVTRRVPPRNYLYFHETQVDEPVVDEAALGLLRQVQIGWRIVGGKTIDIQEAPYQVLYGEYCGGSLIAPEWVITAAHCKEKETFILAGSTYRSKATRYHICAHFTHPLWSSESKDHPHDFDYQLVLLEVPVPISAMARPIAIGTLEDIVPGHMVSISGWGHVAYKKSRMQDILRRVSVPVVPDAICKHLPNENYRRITPRMFCAGYINGTKDSCQGDSGGPVVVNGKLVGLVSFGVGCAMAEQPGVYTKIPYVRDWIRAITALPL